MNCKQSKIILSTILLVSALLLNQCDATAQHDVDIMVVKRDVAVLGSPSNNLSVTENEKKTTTVRHLEEQHIMSDQPFFHTLLATIIVNVITLLGLLSLIPILLRQRWSYFKSAFWAASYHQHAAKNTREFFHLESFSTSVRFNATVAVEDEEENPKHRLANIFFPAFTTGTILAVVLFLIFPESIELIQLSLSSSHSGEIEIMTGTTSRFGTCVMIGFLFPLLLGALCPRSAERARTDASNTSEEKIGDRDMQIQKSTTIEEGDENESDDDDDDDGDGDETKSDNFKVNDSAIVSNSSADIESVLPAKENRETGESRETWGLGSIATCVLVGDSIHNFFDGMFIGVGFMTCSNAVAVFITMVTLYIDIQQKLADYFLVTKSASLSIPRAILLIFTPCILLIVGSLVILASDPDEMVVGVFLAFAAGLFMHVSTSVTLPRVYEVVTSSKDRCFAIFCVVLGAIPVGLCLLDDDKCNA